MEDIIVRGVCSQSGFGVATIGFLKLLKLKGVNFKFVQINAHSPEHRKGFTDEELEWLDSISIRADADISNNILIDIGSLVYGLNIPIPKCKKKIFYTTYETNNIHPKYVNMLNNKYDEIWTASNYNVMTFRSSGVTKPITVVPHYIDFSEFEKDDNSFQISNKASFNFLFWADLTHRKGLHITLQAYLDEFKYDEDVSLILKLSKSTTKDGVKGLVKDINHILFNIDKVTKNKPKILLMTDFVEYNQVPGLYKAADCFINTSLGEGFALNIAEAMASKLPIIAPRCSAPVDYLNSNISYMIDIDDKNPQIPTHQSMFQLDPHYQGTTMNNVSLESTKKQMRKAFEDDTIEAKGIASYNKIKEYLNPDAIFNKIKDVLND